MKDFSLDLRGTSPLAIRSDHAPGGVETAKYISGTTLAGSLAAVHRAIYPHRTDKFELLFLSGQISYPNLFPAVFKDYGLYLDLPVYPVPQTAQSCKRHGGFLDPRDEEDEERHGVRDGLLDWAMFKLLEDGKGKKAPVEALRRHKDCSYQRVDGPCNETMDHFGGYYRRERFAPHRMVSAQVESHTRLQMHTGINRETGTVQEGILYSREVFEEDMAFWGRINISGDEQLASQLTDFIEEIAHEGLARIGTGRTRGLGRVSLAIEPVDEEEDKFSTFKKRLEAFNNALYEQAKTFALADISPFYFALTLYSPLILYDSQLRYQGRICGETLAELAGTSTSKFDLIYQAASVRRVMGWNELWGTPRTHDYAIETGSVFLFSCSAAPDDAVLRSLFDLEEQGIGQRRPEGFGRICFSDPFHLEVELR